MRMPAGAATVPWLQMGCCGAGHVTRQVDARAARVGLARQPVLALGLLGRRRAGAADRVARGGHGSDAGRVQVPPAQRAGEPHTLVIAATQAASSRSHVLAAIRQARRVADLLHAVVGGRVAALRELASGSARVVSAAVVVVAAGLVGLADLRDAGVAAQSSLAPVWHLLCRNPQPSSDASSRC